MNGGTPFSERRSSQILLKQSFRTIQVPTGLAVTDLPARLESPLGESRYVIPSEWHRLAERLFIKAASPE
jgi:hypothetical protein